MFIDFHSSVPTTGLIVGHIDRFTFSLASQQRSEAILAKTAPEIFTALMRDIETEDTMLAAKQVLDATLARGPDGERTDDPFALDGGRDCLRKRASEAVRTAEASLTAALALGPEARRVMMRERAAVSLLGACWLDGVSQPATQPAAIVNLLFNHRWRLLGEGRLELASAMVRRRAFECAGVNLLPIGDAAFVSASGTSDTAALQAAFLLALARFPANYLPEVIGVHAVISLFGIDDALAGTTSPVSPDEAWGVAETFFDNLEDLGPARAEQARRRLANAMAVMAELEAAHVSLLVEIAARAVRRTLDDRVADIVTRHAPFAGPQHGRVRVGGELLSDRLRVNDFDVATFLRDFKRSWYVRTDANGSSRFMAALKLGGPMFGIFTADEARLFQEWIARVPEMVDEPVALTPARPDEPEAGARLAWIRTRAPDAVVFEVTRELDDRELLYRLVNYENYPSVLATARERARAGLERAELLFETGSAGRYTDASLFDYSSGALFDRVMRIYWDKLVNPYSPLCEIPDREAVVFGQKIFALGSLIDGSWAFRVGTTGRYERASTGLLFSIYADEMGFGDICKNHITLIYRVLASLGIALPHIRDAAFIDQDEIPDAFYAFPLNQLCLGLFPDAFYPEILGYNLGIEMFGLGEMRLHEMQKLKHWGFDPIYEEAHLSIDNMSAGHARQAATIIRSHLDDAERHHGRTVAAAEWRRIWNGYASFAYFSEGGSLEAPPTAMAAVLPKRQVSLSI